MKKLLCSVLIMVMLLTSLSGFAMSTYNFDRGMAKGISYFNRGMYYEARDEFQWFCDYNWGAMNPGQQQYALDYLDGAKAKIWEWENRVTVNNFYFNLLGKTKAQVERTVGPQIDSMWYEGPLYKHRDTGDTWYGYSSVNYGSNGSFYAPSNATCTTIVATVGDIINTNNWSYNNLGRISKVFNFKGGFYSELDGDYYYSFKYKNYDVVIDVIEYDSPITKDSPVWIYNK